MSSDLTIIDQYNTALAAPKRGDYEISPRGPGCNTVTLKRDTDFGKIPKTKKPSLYKSGAEKIASAYGLFPRYSPETKIETVTGDSPFFFYMFRCTLVKPINGVEYVVAEGFGSANTAEKRNGFNGAYDAANSAVKMSKKRAFVDAVLSLSGLSDMFTQDVENDDFMDKAQDVIKEKPTDKITPQQVKRLFAIAAENGLNQTQTKQKCAALGFTSTKDITQQDYDRVCDALAGKEVANG